MLGLRHNHRFLTRLRHAGIPLALFALAASCATGTSDSDTGGLDSVDGSTLPISDAAIAGADAADASVDSQCPTQPCDLHEQCGCEGLDACDLEFTDFQESEVSGELTCRSVTTAGNELSTCSSPTACAAGFQCVSGQCRRYCQSNEICGGPGGECVLRRSSSDRDDDRLCSKSCRLEHPDVAPEGQEGCPRGFGCFVRDIGSGDDVRHVTDCRPENASNGFNAQCENRSDCRAGFVCIRFTSGDNVDRRCRHQCAEGQTCPNGEPCRAFDIEIDGTRYGYCPDAS